MKFNEFEIFNDKNVRVFVTNSKGCLPEEEHVKAMLKNGYKFKLDGKLLSKKAIIEIYKER